MKVLTMVLFLGLAACAKEQHTKSVSIDQAIQPFVDQWHEDAATYNGGDIAIDDLIIQFGVIQGSDGDNGLCEVSSDKTPTITIDSNWWAQNIHDQWTLQEMIYHEMGHCILRRAHDNTTTDWTLTYTDGATQAMITNSSIMSWDANVDPVYSAQNPGKVLTEYFKNERGTF